MTSKKCARAEQTALLPELPPELWNKITNHLTRDFADCACVRLLDKRNAEEYEWQMLHAGFRVELEARRRKFEAKRVSADAQLEAGDPMRLAHLSRLQGANPPFPTRPTHACNHPPTHFCALTRVVRVLACSADFCVFL